MPIFKYKTFAEAKQALWNFHTDSAYFKQVADLWDIAGELCPMGYPHGVFKYRSLEEANEERRQWDVSNALKMRSQGTGPSAKRNDRTRLR